MQRASTKQCSQQCDYLTVSQGEIQWMDTGVFYDTILNAACLSSAARIAAHYFYRHNAQWLIHFITSSYTQT